MDQKILIRIHRLMLEIITKGYLEDRAEYDVDSLMISYQLDARAAQYLYNMIRNAMNA